MLRLLVVVMLMALAKTASAFCGFYVAGSNKSLTNDATQVVLMRKGTRTVLAMQNDYKGPPEAFALVVPVPVVLQQADVKTLPKEVFAHVEAMGAPRLVEYWEQDPCRDEGRYGAIGMGFGTGTGYGVGGGRGGMRGRDLGVTVEAKFAVGEYQILILSAKDSTGLDTWLREEKFVIPEGAEPLLRPYVEGGMKFFVAKVDPSKVTFDATGRAALSPLRFHYDSEEFSLPIRLGLANSSGTQDLIVSIFAPYQRYEVANYKNVTIPTNIDVDDRVRTDFRAFYAQLFDTTLARNPGSVVTEYAWQATKCDPCTGPTLTPQELATLGGDVLDNVVQEGGGIPNVSIGQPAVTGDLDKAIIRRYIKRNIQKIQYCYEKELLQQPTLSGTINLAFGIAATGAVTQPTGSGVSPAVSKCVVDVIARIEFPKPKAGTVKVTYPLTFALVPGGGGRGGWGSDFVLTRLHARYGKEIKDDLVFKKAEPIVGGREFSRDGKLEHGARPDFNNNFQARYAIRHAWKGAITCASPRRNVWGGPPEQETRSTEPIAATNIAFAPRTGAPLSQLVKTDVPELAVVAGAEGLLPPLPVEPPPAAPTARTETRETTGGGCGCESNGGGGGMFAVLAGLVVILRRRRARGAANVNAADV